MGKVVGAYLMPHPPIILQEIGKGEEAKIQATIDSIKRISLEIREKKPDILIMITPHGPLFRDAVTISAVPELKGDFKAFGAKELKFLKSNHVELVKKIVQLAGKNHIICVSMDKALAKQYNVSLDLDHGTMVPLYFIDKEYSHYKLIHITYGLLPGEELYQFGKCVQEALEGVENNAVIIASGDLSHKLTEDAPAGYHHNAKDFDRKLLGLLETGKTEELLEMDPCLIEQAGECGLRSILIMLGVLDGYDITTNILSYEGPFGVGYGVARINIGFKNNDRLLVEKLFKNRRRKMNLEREKEDEYVRLAREALEHYVRENKMLSLKSRSLSKELINNKAGVFVSIKKHGELRGCIGTIKPVTDNIAEEILRNAIQAGMADPRFYPVEEEELDQLSYSVDVLDEPEYIEDLDQLDVYTYGVIVSSEGKSGLLLPNLENVHTVEEQVKIALKKAGIREDEKYNLQRFKVTRHK